ncbi:MAG TPA: serine/threonine-protein kinase [Polyangiales bacterium]
MASPPLAPQARSARFTEDVPPRSAPRNTEEGRALLQARLAQFGRVGVAIAVVFLALGVTAALTMELASEVESISAQAASLAINVGVWWWARGGARSERALLTIDALGVWAQAAVFIGLGLNLPLYTRPELIELVCITDVLVMRSFLVPSSARRTAWISSAPLLAILVSTYLSYRGQRSHPDAPDWPAYVVLAFIFSLGSLALVTLTSRTIFGLRARVREAFQLGQYTLLEKLGEGGMGVVYKARHATLRRPTAIKLLPPERAGEHNLSRFEREVQLTSQLTHPNTIAIFDYGRSADGVLYYAMEYLDGVDLERLIALSGPQPASRVVHILTQVCGALAEAHDVGLIHRDIKPGNVLLCQRGGLPDVAKVVDFGLVKEIGGADGGVSSTRVDQMIGTPLYMSPEAIISPQKLDARSDLYALGAVGYFLLTGQPPFSGASVVEVCSHHLHTTPEPPSQRLGSPIAHGLEATILACLQKDPAQRPDSARSLARSLEACEVPRWQPEQAGAWWHTNRESIEQHRQRAAREAAARASTLPHEALEIDLRTRTQEGVVAWHDDVREAPG